MKQFVISGTREEFERYRNRKFQEKAMAGEDANMNHWMYVRDEMVLRGWVNPHGVFIGTYRNRPDLLDIVRTLMMQSSVTNPVVEKLWNELRPKRPTPKKTAMQIMQEALDDAGMQMAKEIDKEVLKQLMVSPNVIL